MSEIILKKIKTTGANYNLPGHGMTNMTFTILEQVRSNAREQKKDWQESSTFFIVVLIFILVKTPNDSK